MTKINVQRNAIVTKKFSELEIGDFFTYPDYPDDIYQKTIKVKDVVYPNEEVLNTVVVAGDETGNIIRFEDDEDIIPIKTATISY